jgi:putative ABC transport system substrate-binding protein
MKIFNKVVLSSLIIAASCSTGFAAEMKKIAISTIVEVPSLMDAKQGILDALADRGYVVGKNLELEYQSANGSMPTQQQIAKKFIGGTPDVIVPITTPTAQSMVASTKDIPIVFTAVTDPIKAKLVKQFKQPGANVTGVSDAAPIGPQLDFYKRIVPNLKTIGFIYNPGLDNALAALAIIKEEGAKRGIKVVESAAPTTNEVILATKKLIGKVDAVYVPNDTTVVAALEAIVKIGQDVNMPIFAGDTGAVKRGVLAGVGLDYNEVGRVTGAMVADVLDGKKPGTIDTVAAYKVVSKFKIIVNLESAKNMDVEIPTDILAEANEVIPVKK